MKTKLISFLILNSSFLLSAYGGSATWNATAQDGDWHNANNWTPRTVPETGEVATFGESNITAITFINDIAYIDSAVFNPGASAFTITSEPLATLGFQGAGIINNSDVTQNFVTEVDDFGFPGYLM